MEWIALITAILKFPAEFLALAKFLSKTPAEKQQDVMLSVNKWLEESAASDRPRWEDQ